MSLPSQIRLCAYRWGLDDGDGLDDLLLVQLGTGTVQIADDGGHAGLVAHGRGEVDGLLGVILREAAGVVSCCSNFLAMAVQCKITS
jgi:hypothetical protein